MRTTRWRRPRPKQSKPDREQDHGKRGNDPGERALRREIRSAQYQGKRSDNANRHHAHGGDHDFAPVSGARHERHTKAEADQRRGEQAGGERRHALIIEPQRLGVPAENEKGEAEP